MRFGLVCVQRSCVFVGILVFAALSRQCSGQDDAVKNGTQRVLANQLLHHQASHRMGLLIPLYIYPADIHQHRNLEIRISKFESRNPKFEI